MRRRTLVEATLPLDAHGACAVVESAANRTLNPANPLFQISYDLCTGQTAPAASAFTCTVEQAATPTGDPLPLTGITCSVSVP